MAINVVENVNGAARVNLPGVMILGLGILTASAIIPALGMWFVFADPKLAGTAIAVGFLFACGSLPMLVLQQMRLPLDKLPIRS